MKISRTNFQIERIPIELVFDFEAFEGVAVIELAFVFELFERRGHH